MAVAGARGFANCGDTVSLPVRMGLGFSGMRDAILQPAVYTARRMLMGAALVFFGVAFGIFAHALGEWVTHMLRRSGYFPAMLEVIIGAYLIVQAGLRFPRIDVGVSFIAAKGMFAEDRAAWVRLGLFEVDARAWCLFRQRSRVCGQA